MIGKSKFYTSGLHFQCTNCGNCCRLTGGKVFLSQMELHNISRHLGLQPDKFEEKFCHPGNDKKYLIDRKDGACIFLNRDHCQIYLVRPLQCRTFPFWPENLKSHFRWKQLKSFCPGIDQGPLISVEKIRYLLETQKKVDQFLINHCSGLDIFNSHL